ncbi:MAG TPA: sugar kinase [Ignavibacteriaceae bacterium]|nr:sugar kinase [Ignavibacteriaceae bacterium]
MKVVTIGEIMLRLSTPGFNRFVQSTMFDVNYGGGEANVAISLANYGLDAYFVTKLPKHEIGQAAVNSLKKFGVKDDYIVRGGDRIGIYFLETGASQRASKVIYDRANASINTLTKDEIDWDKVFNNAKWFHWTGITPALGEKARDVIKTACIKAKEHRVIISADLNYRAKLWTTNEAQSVMVPLMEYVDVCIANEEDAEKSLGFNAGTTDVHSAQLDEVGYVNLVKELKKKFSFKAVAITLRESFSASRNGWSAILHDEKDCITPYRSKRYDIQIVDRVGGGDAFAGGLIYGLLTKNNSQHALEYAVAASCLKQTIPGDFNLVSVDEVNKLAVGSGSGRVER